MKFSRLKRLYIDQPLAIGGELYLDSENIHYIRKVLRLKNNDRIRIFNQRDGEFLAKFINSNHNSNPNPHSKSNITILIIEQLRAIIIPQIQLTLGLAIVKTDAMQVAIQMAVQLGVSNIIPIKTARSQYSDINYSRFTAIIIEATRQSERLELATLLPIKNLKDCQSYFTNYSIVIYANENEINNQTLLKVQAKVQNILSSAKDKKHILLIVGPEGGFTDEEIHLMQQKNTISVSLGPNVLKTETAVAAFLAQFNLFTNSINS